MKTSTILTLAVSILFAVIAVFGVRSYLANQASMLAAQQQAEEKAPENTIVVAAQPMRFGKIVEPGSLRVIPWPAAKLPDGAFRTIDEVMFEDGSPRYVMSAIETDEPLLASKLTGPGQRATLSAALTEGMKAVSIRVNDVLGVAGFVLPGDRVDILLTRTRDDAPFTDVLLQGVRVLAIDQIADDRADKPSVVRTVTFEVSTREAQKLTLAANVGTLSLALRNIASAEVEDISPIDISDLGGGPTSAALLKEQELAAREARIAELEAAVRQVGEDVDAKVAAQLAALKKEFDSRPQPQPIIVQAPAPAPAPEVVRAPPPPAFVGIGVFRNTERVEYKVKSSVKY